MVYQSPAPPRQKSCEACKVSKRRCDLAFPVCSLCVKKNIPCVYPGRQPAAYANFDLDVASLVDSGPEYTEPFPFLAGPVPTPDINVHATPTFVTPGVGSSYFNHQPQLPCPAASQVVPLPRNYGMSNPRAKPPKPLSEIVSLRLQFSMDVLKDAPRSMVMQNQTPWSHPQLYKNYMPRSMQDAYGCCSLYTSKNEVNAPVIMALIEARIQDLLSSPEPTTLAENLARTHALLLYQIMHLFDGDIRSHATAQALFATLESAVLTLLAFVQFPDQSETLDLLGFSTEPITDFWESWVLHESARRTILFSFYFIQVYKLLQGNTQLKCDGKLGINHSWYLSAHLWHAQSAFDFAVAWTNRQHFIIYNLDFSPALSLAHPEDVDVFGRMLLVTVLGIDEVKAWFHTRGALL